MVACFPVSSVNGEYTYYSKAPISVISRSLNLSSVTLSVRDQDDNPVDFRGNDWTIIISFTFKSPDEGHIQNVIGSPDPVANGGGGASLLRRADNNYTNLMRKRKKDFF